MKERSDKMKKGKKILFIIGIIIVIIISLLANLIIKDLKIEDQLKQEIVNISNKNLLTDNYDIHVVTTGDYAYVEEAIKKFYKELSDNIKTMNLQLNNEALINILSANNIKTDGPDFVQSYQLLDEVQTKSSEALNNIAALCNEEYIKNLLDKEKVDSYYIDLYQQLMYTEKDLETFRQTKEEMETLNNNLNTFLNKVRGMLQMLQKNQNSWKIENGQLYFNQNSLVNEYNRLYNELKTFAAENFDSKTTTNSTNSNI